MNAYTLKVWRYGCFVESQHETLKAAARVAWQGNEDGTHHAESITAPDGSVVWAGIPSSVRVKVADLLRLPLH